MCSARSSTCQPRPTWPPWRRDRQQGPARPSRRRPVRVRSLRSLPQGHRAGAAVALRRAGDDSKAPFSTNATGDPPARLLAVLLRPTGLRRGRSAVPGALAGTERPGPESDPTTEQLQAISDAVLEADIDSELQVELLADIEASRRLRELEVEAHRRADRADEQAEKAVAEAEAEARRKVEEAEAEARRRITQAWTRPSARPARPPPTPITRSPRPRSRPSTSRGGQAGATARPTQGGSQEKRRRTARRPATATAVAIATPTAADRDARGGRSDGGARSASPWHSASRLRWPPVRWPWS